MTAVAERTAPRYEDALFGSVHQALMFAYTFVPNQHAQAAAAERLISLFGHGRYEQDAVDLARSIRPGRGLIGLDGAAQAGMVKSAVRRLPERQQWAIEARFDILEPIARSRAMARLTLSIRGEHGCTNARVLQYLVQMHYGAKGDVREVLTACFPDVSRATAFRRWRAVRRTLQRHEDAALEQLADGFRATGIVEA